MSAPPQQRAARQGALVGAEVGLLALGLGSAISFTRLFEDWSWLGLLAIPVTVSWLLSLLLRRTGTGVALSSVVQTGVAVLVLSWLFAPDTLALFLPTPATWTALAAEVSSSFSSFSELVAPVPATDGFLFVIGAALWTIGTFADIAAIRYRAPVQAAVPYVASFVAVGILARDSGRTTSALAFALALGIFAVTQQALGATERRWVAGRVARGTGAVFSGALAIALVAVIGAMAFGPLLPGGSRPVIDLRQLGSGEGPRTVVSPFVGIRSLLGERSDQVMFTVRADDPAYWRLTSLERYDPDRQIWVSRSSFRPTDGELPPTMDAEIDSRPLRQEYRLEALSTVWLPAAYVPRTVDSPAPLGFDPDSASLFLRERGSESERGLRYEVQSQLPELAPVIDSAEVGRTADLDREYLTTPPIDGDAEALLASVTAEADGPYQQLLALQNWFRSDFTYDDGVDFSQEPDALGAFLATRRGFCQQFALDLRGVRPSPRHPQPCRGGLHPGGPGRHRGRRRCRVGPGRSRCGIRRVRPTPGRLGVRRAGTARPCLARGPLGRHRLGALRTHTATRESAGTGLHRRRRRPGSCAVGADCVDHDHVRRTTDLVPHADHLTRSGRRHRVARDPCDDVGEYRRLGAGGSAGGRDPGPGGRLGVVRRPASTGTGRSRRRCPRCRCRRLLGRRDPGAAADRPATRPVGDTGRVRATEPMPRWPRSRCARSPWPRHGGASGSRPRRPPTSRWHTTPQPGSSSRCGTSPPAASG